MRPRRRTAANGDRISLFPFLAVLICTMGSLLVLLVVIAQRAQATAHAQAETDRQQLAKGHETTLAQLDALEQEVRQLQALRADVGERLRRRREALSHVEDHMRRMRDELRRLKAAAQQMDDVQDQDADKLAKLAAELRRVQGQLAEAERLLEVTRQQTTNGTISHAIVPYVGPNGTRRRPIYIECLADSVVLQPEGIVLTEQDFMEPLGPDNPLATALRAGGEYLNHRQATSGRPYPLLLVRPKGIAAYYAARAALEAWESDFGYELIGEDWDLAFPAADPQLARVVYEALEIARRRHRSLVRRHLAEQRRGNSAPPGRPSAAGRPGFGRLVEREDANSAPRQRPFSNKSKSNGPNSGHGGDTAEDQVVRPSDLTAAAETGAAAPPGSVRLDVGAASAAPQSIAATRGDEWALPGASSGSVPFTRPLRIQCASDQLVIVPRDGRSAPIVVPMPAATRDAMEQLVSAIWDHMRSWGIAGQGLYWKPVLNVYVAPGARQCADDLVALLKDSGLEVRIQQ